MVYYNTPARLMSSHACREILRRFAKSVNVYEDIPAVMHLQVQQAFIEFSGPRTRHKPRLVLQGKPLKSLAIFRTRFRNAVWCGRATNSCCPIIMS